MPIIIQSFTDNYVVAVRKFNQRTKAGGMALQFPESPTPQWLPRRERVNLYQEYFVALDGAQVRGGYIAKPQVFACNGELERIACYQLPISEGAVDNRYAVVGLLMLKDALKRYPLLFALGLGGYNEFIARMLRSVKWSLVSCPFYFKVSHPFRFLRGITFLRRKWLSRVILDTFAFSGLGWLGIKSVQGIRGMKSRVANDVVAEEIGGFSTSTWTDEIWNRAKENYSLIALRDAAVLDVLYPSNNRRFKRVIVLREGKGIGWAVMMLTKMAAHKHFGNMRVGSIVDCLAVPGREGDVISAATQWLEDSGAEIIVSNQLHASWCRAFASNGYLAGPSNYIFAASKSLTEKLYPFESQITRVHMTRGDGDGPIHL